MMRDAINNERGAKQPGGPQDNDESGDVRQYSEALVAALRVGDDELVRQMMLSQQPQFIVECCAWCDERSGDTLLHLAAAAPSASCLVALLQGGGSDVPLMPFQCNHAGETPLHVAARSAHSLVPLLLLVTRYGISTARTSDERCNFLHLLFANPHLREERRLLDFMAWLMSGTGTTDAMQTMLNELDAAGRTVYDVALMHHADHPGLLQQLMSYGACRAVLLAHCALLRLIRYETRQRGALWEEETTARRALQRVFLAGHAYLLRCADARDHVLRREKRRRDAVETHEAQRRQRLTQRCRDEECEVVRRASEAAACLARQQMTLALLVQRLARGWRGRQAITARMAVATHESEGMEDVAGGANIASHAVDESPYSLHTSHLNLAHMDEVDEKKGSFVRRAASRDGIDGSESSRDDDHADTLIALPTVTISDQGNDNQDGIHEACVDTSTKEKDEKSISSEVRRAMAARRVWRAYCAYKRRKSVAIEAEEKVRLERRQRAARVILHAWLAYRERMVRIYDAATTTVLHALQHYYFAKQRKLHIVQGIEMRQRERVRGCTRAITQLVWRENLCGAVNDIIFAQKHRRPVPRPRLGFYARWQVLCRKWVHLVLLAQVGLALVMLVYMGVLPRTAATVVHNKVDLALICVELIVAALLLPHTLWTVLDLVVVLTALICAATRAYGGVITVTLLLLKIPFVVRAFVPAHTGTRTYCRALEHVALYLALLFPVALAGLGATGRGAVREERLASRDGNVGTVLLCLMSTIAPQYALLLLLPHGDDGVAMREVVDAANCIGNVRTWRDGGPVGSTMDFLLLRSPLTQILVCKIVLYLYCWSAIVMGTVTAIHSHYDMSDSTRLRGMRHRIGGGGRAGRLLEAHRAANMEALGQQLSGGVTWDADVLAAKEAVTASYYHTAPGPSARNEDAAAATSAPMAGPARATVAECWDSRNEDVRLRAALDVAVIEQALGMVERQNWLRRFVERQWTGLATRREMNAVVIVMLVMAAVRPDLYVMEAAFSAIFTLELFLSFYVLRLGFCFSHPIRLLLRLFCVVVGFVPSATPFVAFRALRLCEGWSAIFVVPGLVRWVSLYLVLSLLTLWLVATVAMLQHWHQQRLTHRPGGEGATVELCESTAHCFGLTLRELVLPAWTPQHISPAHEAPLMAMLVLAFQYFFIPFAMSFVLHPLLQLSSFIGRFLRLVVYTIHRDFLSYLDNYIEGEAWYEHWRLKAGLPPSVATKLKMWVYDFRRKSALEVPAAGRGSFVSGFLFPVPTFTSPTSAQARLRDLGAGLVKDEPDEVISRARCVSFTPMKGGSMSLISPRPHYQQNRFSAEAHWASPAEATSSSISDSAVRRRSRRQGGSPAVTRVLHRIWRLWLQYKHSRVLHAVNVVLTLLSLAFLWVASGVTAVSPRHDGRTVAAAVIHLLSIVSALLVIPLDCTVVLTGLSCGGLFVAVVTVLLPYSVVHRRLYALRFLSVARLGQLQIGILRTTRRELHVYLRSTVIIFFPVVAVGVVVFVVELLRAQIYLTTTHLPLCPSLTSSSPSDSTAASWGSGSTASLSQADELSTCTAAVNWSYPQQLASHRQRGGGGGTTQASSSAERLFAYYFKEDATILYAIFNVWLLPGICISTCLARLFWSGENQRDARLHLAHMVTWLEDPVTVADFPLARWGYRWPSNVLLLVSLVLGCVIGPATRLSGRADDHVLFFSLEIVFAVLGFVASVMSLMYSAHRCGRSWACKSLIVRDRLWRRVIVADSICLVGDVLTLLYYTVALSLSVSLLREYDDCLISATQYATYFVTLRFVLLLRLLPRQLFFSYLAQKLMLLFSILSVIVVVVAAASAVADLAAIAQGTRLTAVLWRGALNQLLRASMTEAVPSTLDEDWKWYNMTDAAAVLGDTTAQYTSTNFIMTATTFVLSILVRVHIASVIGLSVATFLVPWRTTFLTPLPPRSRRLYEVLCGGVAAMVRYGTLHHDDMRPDTRRRLQRRKFRGLFGPLGIPSWALPHLLEELHICRPSRQRRCMFVLRSLLDYLPIKEAREAKVRQYVDQWEEYRAGAPAPPGLYDLPIYPRPTPPQSPLSGHATGTTGSIAPLRLVQALTYIELGFPADSSVSSKLWLDFFTVVQKQRGATLLQSLWRMYQAEKRFDLMHTLQEKICIALLRRSFRKYRVKADVVFRSYGSFAEALRMERELYNPGTGHYDLLNRLQGQYARLRPTREFVIRPVREVPDAMQQSTNMFLYMSRYMRNVGNYRTSVTSLRGGFGPVNTDFASTILSNASPSMATLSATHRNTR